MEGDSDTGLVRVLFQVGRAFFVGALLMRNLIIPKNILNSMNEGRRGHFLYWHLDLRGEVL